MDNMQQTNAPDSQDRLFKTGRVLGVEVAATDMDAAIGTVCDSIDALRGEYLCFTNAHTTVTAYGDDGFLQAQNSSVATFPDGKPVAVVMKMRGHKSTMRVTGPDFMGKMFEMSEQNGLSHYFYGSTEDTISVLREKLLEKYPNIKIAGMYSPPFRELSAEDDEKIVEMINSAAPDIVWVGLGAPKQENWMLAHKGRINALMAGVGAGFDYHAGKLRRAPKWMQTLCLEWLYRLIQEPRRLFGRYISTNTKFIWLNLFGRKHKTK